MNQDQNIGPGLAWKYSSAVQSWPMRMKKNCNENLFETLGVYKTAVFFTIKQLTINF